MEGRAGAEGGAGGGSGRALGLSPGRVETVLAVLAAELRPHGCSVRLQVLGKEVSRD